MIMLWSNAFNFILFAINEECSSGSVALTGEERIPNEHLLVAFSYDRTKERALLEGLIVVAAAIRSFLGTLLRHRPKGAN